MRLCFQSYTGKIAVHLTRLKRCSYNLEKIFTEWSSALDGLIVLGDGTPDDIIIGILIYHLSNGNKIIGITKPNVRGIDTLTHLKTLTANVDRVLLLIDQDNYSTDELSQKTELKMRDLGINCEIIAHGDKYVEYLCSFGNKHFDLILVINGVDDVTTTKHTIEDHLVKYLGIDVSDTSKDAWNQLTKNEMKDIFRKLKNDRGSIQRLFPQQLKGLELLER